ncbi:MAG: right-handed parallel beta-helix repeat-containing protein [Proteobacteria bacterium]|nr:right-handed parallel beta-helix repeat-containing protein [Pseudomonadota bacterium]
MAIKCMGKKNVIFAVAVLLVTLFGVADTCMAATIRAGANGQSIQGAIDAAAPGDLVLVADGEYTENISITKQILLHGVSSDTDSKDTGVVIVARDAALPVVKVEGTTGVTIDGINVKGSIGEAGILVLGSSKTTVTRSSAVENRIGISLVNSESSIITNNRTEFNETYGIYLERSNENTVTENRSGQNRDKGIFLSYANRNEISANSTNHNVWNGILLWDSDDNRITDNEAYRNMYSIIESESTGNLYDDNSTLPNLYIILPIIMTYTGIIFYLLQRLIIGRILGLIGKKE